MLEAKISLPAGFAVRKLTYHGARNIGRYTDISDELRCVLTDRRRS